MNKTTPFLHPIRFVLLLALISIAQWSDGQLVPDWDRSYGGSIWEELNSVVETNDGGFVLAGFSSSAAGDGNVTQANQGGGDYWVVKTDIDGNLLWDARFGGSELDRCNSIQQTNDGGYILGGTSASGSSGDKSGASRGLEDYWVIKIDALGNLEWEQSYGGDQTDFLTSLIQTSDGGYLMGGRSRSGISGEKSEPNYGDFDHWLIKIDPNGVIEWEQAIGGAEEERLNVMEEASDGHFLVAGSSRSNVDNDVGLPLLGVKDYWFLKLSSLDGSIIWERRYGGTDEDELLAMEQTTDGGYLLAGGSRSNMSVWKSQDARGLVDMWVIKTDAAGNREWDRTFGGASLDNCYSIKENSAGFYLLGGFSGSGIGIDKTEPNIGGWDYWMVYLNDLGEKQWDKTIGGDANDVMFNLFQTSGGGYLLAGHSSSDVSGDKTDPTKGLNDFWLVKTACDVSVDFRDTIVCPLQPVVLDAFTNASCPGCTWIWSDIGIGDSIRTILPSGNMSLSVTLVDQVGCERSDQIDITVLPAPDADLGADPLVCAGQSTTLDAGNPGLLYQWSTNETSQVISVEAPATYYLTVTAANGCTDVDSVVLQKHPLPVVDLGPDFTTCANLQWTFDAGNPGSSYQWFPVNANDQMVNYTIDSPVEISVTVTDVNNCSAADTVVATEIWSSPELVNMAIECDLSNNNFYQVTLTLGGGDQSTYQVNGGSGTLNGNVFVSDPIPSGTAYNFQLSDGNACTPEEVSGSFVCPCFSSAGLAQTTPLTICGAAIGGPVFDQIVADANDVLEYVLHDGTSQQIGNVLLRQNQASFQYQDILDYGTTYFISLLVGNDDGTGQVDLNDACFDFSEGVPITFFPAPTALILPETSTSLTCTTSSLVLSGASSQPLGQVNFFWEASDGGNIISNPTEPSVELNQAGRYQLIVSDLSSACRDTASILITAEDDFPEVIIADPLPLTCLDSIVQLDASASSQGPQFTYEWAGGDIAGNNTLNPQVMEAGLYTLSITNNDNACVQSASVAVVEDRAGPLVDAGGLSFLSCDTGTANLSAVVTSSSNDLSIQWRGPDGNLVNTNDLSISVAQAGTYELQVQDNLTGCIGKDQVVVDADPNGPQDAIVVLNSPSCFGENDGAIVVDAVIGGQAPYAFAWNRSDAFSANANQLSRLEAGQYTLTIKDDNACIWETQINLSQPQQLLVDLGEDQELLLGDSVQLEGFVNQAIDTFFWSPPNYLSCLDCLDPFSRPLNEVRYSLTVVDANGCQSTDGIQLLLNKQRNVYIPSAFSPNGDGANDWLTVFGGQGIERINYFRVFNRWGALVYERNRFQPNDLPNGWDGTFRGRDAAVGVYLFVAEVLFEDGWVESYQGDVTLFR
ncbi:MAG: gliding motility-associated C-terminal domain-containing protein [Bacteroidota bacterium]